MPSIPKLSGTAAKVPLSINPENGKLIYYDAVANGEDKVVPVDQLSPEQQQKLVISRIKAQPGFTQVDMNGNQISSKELISQIKKGEEDGTRYLDADISYLKDFLPQFNQE